MFYAEAINCAIPLAHLVHSRARAIFTPDKAAANSDIAALFSMNSLVECPF